MSHFTVIVTGEDIEGQMAPYDENTQVEEYRSYEDDFWYVSVVEREHPEVDHTDLRAVVDVYNAKYGDDGDEQYLFDEEGRLYTLSTYNPEQHRLKICRGYAGLREGQESRRSAGAQALWEVRPDQALLGVHESGGQTSWTVRLVSGLPTRTQLSPDARAETSLASATVRDLAGGLRGPADAAERALRCLLEAIGTDDGGGSLSFDGEGAGSALSALQHALGPRGGEALHASCGSEVPHVPHVLRDVLTGGSKWDYWRIGGRWAGAFLLKPGRSGRLEPLGWEWEPQFNGGEQPPDMTGRCDQALKGDIDFARMRDEAVDKANGSWDIFERAVADHGPLPSQEWPGEVRSPEWEEARNAYWDHPTVKALKDAELIGFFGFPSDIFRGDCQDFVERARLAAVPGYAFLSEGQWIEPGKMGWWGVSSDTPDSKLEYHRLVNQLIDDLPDDTLLTMLDCHI